MTGQGTITESSGCFTWKKVIDTLNDLPNVLWIVSQEAPVDLEMVEQPPDRAGPLV